MKLLDRELNLLRDRLLLLGGETEKSLAQVMTALTQRSSDAARQVLERDAEIDRLEAENNRHCIEIIALYQPLAGDLRFVISAAKIAPYLENIGDHVCGIARSVIELNDEPYLEKMIRGIPQMAEITAGMLDAALNALIKNDAPAAAAVIALDEDVDRIYENIFAGLTETAAATPSLTVRSLRLILIAKHLERVGDYITHIAETTVYLANAAIIKRRSPKFASRRLEPTNSILAIYF